MSERSFKTRPQCGLCNAVSNVFRRLLCVGPSRRGSSESYYQQLDPMEAYERENEEMHAHSADEVRIRDEQNDNVSVVLAVSEDITVATEALKQQVTVEESNAADPSSRITRAQVQNEPGTATVVAIPVYLYDQKRFECKKLTESESVLINTMEIHARNGILTGRFLTMHKRRRKKLTTRSLSPDLAPALLDDVHHGVVKCMLDRAGQWPFNAFTLDVATGGRSLPVLCVHLFHWYGLLDFFKLEVVDVWKLFTLIEEGYHSTNPYHNSIHATDVTQAMHCFLQEEKIKTHITPIEVMASLIAAVSHDLDHPGVNQPFLIATSNHLAALYQNTSVLENHHWRSAVGCLLESHVADRLRNAMPELERQISSLILATDITRQQEFLTKFRRYLNQDSLQMEKEEDRHFILQIALKCADISNPCRPWEISRKWSQKVCEEFFRQGDYEQQLGLPLTALCDRSSSSVPKIQSGFFKFVVIPLFDEWHRFLGTKLSTNMMSHLKTNHHKWEMLLQQELAEETRTEISDADDATKDECVLSTGGGDGSCPGGGDGDEVDNQSAESRRCSLPSVMLEMVDRTGRRHSVPLNLSRDVAMPSTSSGGVGSRRESLPASVLEPRHKLILDPIPHLEEEDEELDISFRSSCSGSLQKSSDCGSVEERPVSAESLLPEPSIATITTSLEATRLSNVLHGSTMLAPPVNKILTRQQTFPPIQSFVRTRYLSTAGEIVAQPSASNSSSTNSSRNELSSSVRTGSTSSEASDNFNAKRDSSSSEGDRDRTHHARAGLGTAPNSNYAKMAKFSEKENVDPRKDRRSGGGGGGDTSVHHGSLQELLLSRRGSASAVQESVSPPRDREKAIPRRGSVPIEISRPDLLEMPRRRSSDSGKGSRRSSRNRKSLKRRSSGGPDILLPREKLNTPRRGSLPCDVLPTNIKK